jgi:hypothetical protein
MPWFAVKTFLRTRPTGSPKRRDKTYRGGLAAVEERIVLFRSKNADAAIKKGRAEAAKYAKAARTKNVYGQNVITEMLGYTETFELFEDPADGAELFSSIEIVAAEESPSALVRRKVGDPASRSTARLFVAGRISKKLDEQVGEW